MNESLLMPYQNQPFNGDIYIQQEFLNLKKKFGILHTIETGTCLGYTSKWLVENIGCLHSIEINKEYLAFASERLKPYFQRYELILGSSSEILPSVLSRVDNRTIVFLDAHWGDFCPLKDELKIIAQSGLKPVIAIHDFVVPDKPEFGFDSTQGQPFTYEWLKPEFDLIYGENNYNHYYNTGLHEESAKRGIIYLTPKQ